MTIKQLSVFLENKYGRLAEVLSYLGEEKINIKALSIADTSEYGILRLIVNEPERALKVLKDKEFSASLSEVISIETPSEAGSFAKAMKILADEKISIEYVYAFSIGGKAAIVLKAENKELALKAIEKHNLAILKSHELFDL